MNLRARLRFILALIFLAAGFVLPVCAAPLSGTKSVGPTGDYASLTAAIADVQAVGNGLGGALVLELQPAYVSTVETFPLTIPSLNGASAVNTLTIRPANGATARVITSADTTAATVDLNGAQFVTIDGRPGGVGSNAGSGGGTASQLTIANISTSGVALRFINEASTNTTRYTTLRGVNTSSSKGTVFFSTTTGANGNDNNTIDHCDIGDGASTPARGIYALGSTGTTAQNNSGNTISNCNVFNFDGPILDPAGVRLDPGNTDWNVISNSFYQTATRSAALLFTQPILLYNPSGNNFTVTGNFIGGSAPNAGGAPWTATFTSPYFPNVNGIYLSVGTTVPSSVQGNTIANMVWTFDTAKPGTWGGIYVAGGNVNIGTVTGNIIGNATGTGSISLTNPVGSFGIGSASSGTVAIANNTIGSITVSGSASTISASFTGIQVTTGTNTISNNTVGSTTTANSINAATSSTSTTGQQVTGILSNNNTFTSITSVTGNTVANLNNNYIGTATSGQIRGIVVTNGQNTVTGNTVRNLSTTSRNASTSVQSAYGIYVLSLGDDQNVSQNTVHSLGNTTTSAPVSVTGIYYAAPGFGKNVVARNFVHSLAVSSTISGSVLNGMQFDNARFTAQNNVVRVGLKADGTSTAGASTLRGIYDNKTLPGRNYYHNSVYVGGTQTSGTASSRAFDGSTSVSITRSYQNNIFVNARSNSGGTGKHYAVVYGGSGANPTGLTAGGNLFLASGTGGVLGQYNGSDLTTLAAWQAATGQDATSAVADPLFVNPTGSAATVDLHLQPSNPAEGSGIPLIDAKTNAPATVTDDFDGQTRSTLTPADIGADAGNFTLTSDIFSPGISYPLLTSVTPANRVLTGWATITDNVGVSGSANAPRLYFKKSTDADVFGGNTSADNGWKYVTATGSGPYSFTLDYSLINGGSVSPGDTIQYFVVAQDAANNLGSSPAAATASASPPVRNISAKPGAGVNSFVIFKPLNAINTVGTGGDYESLSGPSGVFDAISNTVLTASVVINVTSDLTETGSVSLNQWAESGAGNYTLTIQPDSATMRTISGSATAGLITLNGADRVMVDGRFGGSGKFLTFRNTSAGSSASTILFINDASNNTVRNCVVEGATQSSTLGVIGFSFGPMTGNDNNLITGCQVRDRSDVAGVPLNLIGSAGGSTAVANSGNTVSNNELFNFNQSGISIDQTGNDSWTLSGNSIYEVNAGTGASSGGSVYGIAMQGGGTNFITGNSIHDLLTTNTSSVGILFFGTSTTTIARNRIAAPNVNAAATNVIGILANGSVGSTLNVVNNQITLSLAASNSASLIGLGDIGSVGSVVNASYNSIVLGGTESGTASSWASYRRVASTHTARNNVFLNLRTGGTGNHFAAGSEETGGSYTASNNVYAGTGATAANFMDFSGTAYTAVPVSFATWQSSTGDTASAAGLAGTGSFTAAMFVNAATGDLHLAPGFNPLVSITGTPIAGVTDDFDGDARSPTTPSIGSDEALPFPDVTIEQPAGTVLSDGVSVKDFGGVLANGGNGVANFKITNTGTAPLTGLAVTLDGADAGDFGITQPGSTTLAPGASATFNASFTPTVLGARNAAIHVASNVIGAKNPFDIALTGTGQTVFGVWAIANGVSTDPAANGGANVAAFAFGMAPGASGALVFNGTLGSGGTIGANGLPAAWLETTGGGFEVRALFVRRKNAAAAGLTYSVAFSGMLSTWNTSAVVPAVLADDGTFQIVSVPFPAPMVAGGMGYFHVSVTLAP